MTDTYKFRRTPQQMAQHPDPTGAARAMLAALNEIKRCNAQYNFGSKLLRIVLPAIAQAEAAGIKVSP